MTDVKGIGVDLAQIPRLRRVVERWNDRFLRRVFTEAEIAYCRRRRDPIPHLAARFAAKEATLKALGTGLRMGVNWRELEGLPLGELVALVRGLDPTARLDERNRPRLVRAIEVLEVAGAPLERLRRRTPPPWSPIRIGLTRHRRRFS